MVTKLIYSVRRRGRQSVYLESSPQPDHSGLVSPVQYPAQQTSHSYTTHLGYPRYFGSWQAVFLRRLKTSLLATSR